MRDSRRDRQPFRGQRGFTLIEVLVAFVVLALMLGVILNLNSLALHSTARAGERQLALMLAQSQLERVLAQRDLRPGHERGRFDEDERFDWELEVTRFEFPDREAALEESFVEPYEIALSVHWGADQQLTLNTLRLVRSQ